MWKQDSDILRQASSLDPQQSWGLTGSGLPPVEALLASTAKLMGRTSNLDRTGSKMSSLSQPTTQGSQDFMDKLTQSHDERLERWPTAPGVGRFQPSRLTYPSWVCKPDSPRSGSQGGSPLIRAGQPDLFDAHGRHQGADARQKTPAEKEIGSSSTPHVGQPLRSRPKKLQSQLKKLASSIVALRESISTQAPGRSRTTTRIPVPRPVAAMDTPASAQHRESRCPEGRSALTAEAPPEGHIVREETEVSEWEDDDKAQECWSGQVHPPAAETVIQEEASTRSPAVPVDRKIPTAAEAGQASDPAPAVSALFDSLWDTDDEKSCVQPPKQAKRARSGIHKESAESGTLDRKMRSLEAVWSSILDHKGNSDGGLRLSEEQPPAFAELQPAPISVMQVGHEKRAIAAQEEHTKSPERGTLDGKLQSLQQAGQQTSDAQPSSMLAAVLTPDRTKLDNNSMCFTANRRPQSLAVSALLPADGRQAAAGSASTTGEVAVCTEPATQQVECLNGAASMPMQPAEDRATGDVEEAGVAEHLATWGAPQQSGSAAAAPGQQLSVDAAQKNPQLTAEDAAASHVPAADCMPQQQPSTVPTMHPPLQPLESQPQQNAVAPQQQRPAQEPVTQGGLTAEKGQEQLMQQAPQTISITAPKSTTDGTGALPKTYERIELPLPHVPKRGLRKLKFWKSKSQTGTSDSSLAKSRAQRIASESGRVSGLESPAKSKDSLTRLGSLFRRRSFSAVATAPGQPALPRQSTARPASQVVAESPRMRHAGPACATQLSAHATAQKPEIEQGSVHARTADASSGSDKVAALDDQLAREGVENCENSTQDWAGKEDAVKQLLVPAAVPCELGVTGAQLADTATPAPEGPPAADPATAATTADAEPQCTQTDLRVNTEQWLSNEKAQKGLLLPAWVPSKLPITATSPLSDMPRPDGDTALGTIPSATESRASVPQAGAEEGWLSPERAVKSLLVPSWVPSKLPIGASPPAPEGSSQGDAVPRDLIAAVSPRPSTLLPRAARLDLKASKAPVSATPVSWGSGASSRGHQLASLPSGLREEAVADQNGNHMPTQPPSLPRQAFSLQPAELVPAASVPATAAQTRPVTTALSLQDASPLPQRIRSLGQDSATPAHEPGQGKAKREGFFKALFRRRTESLERTRRSASPKRPVDRRQSESQAGTGSPISLRKLPPVVAQPLPFRHSEPGTAFHGLAARPAVLSEAAVEELVDTRAASLTFSGASVAGQSAQGPQSARELGTQTEFSFQMAPLTGRSAASERSRTPSAGRRRVTDEDLDDLRARFSRLEQTFVNLPPRTPSRERQRHRAQPPRPCRLPQAEFFEAAAGNPRPQPASSTGTAEAVPFIMQKLPLPDADQTKFTDRFSQPAKEHLPASLTTQRWMESLRAPEPTRAASSRSSPAARVPRQEPKPVPSAAQPTAPVPQRSVSPFGRVQCGPERPVPFLSTPRGPAAHLENDKTAESPTSQLEKQLKHAAGADSPRHGSPQWRLIAEHIVKSSEVSELERQPHPTDPKPESEAAIADRKDDSLERLFGEDGIANGTVDRLRFWTEQHAGARPNKQQQQQRRASGGSPPRIVSPQRRGPEPVLVESTRPAFPALKAYLGAKSPGRLPQKPSAEDPELAACRGVSALQCRFESGLLLESNVAALQKQFENQTQPRERTAAWAKGHAQKAAQVQSAGSRPIINGQASS